MLEEKARQEQAVFLTCFFVRGGALVKRPGNLWISPGIKK